MTTLRFSVPGKVFKSFTSSIKTNIAVISGQVKEPTITVEPSKICPDTFSIIVLTVRDEDRSFWHGFIQGSHFTIANRQQWNLYERQR